MGLNEKQSRIIFYSTLGIIIILFLIQKFCIEYNFFSDSVLAITALIVLWYTIETAGIRKAELTIARATEENQSHSKKPLVICVVYTNPDDKYDTRFKLSNLSSYPVSVKVNCNFKINSENVFIKPGYSGEHYWNLQYHQSMEGHFSWLDLLRNEGILTEAQVRFAKTIKSISDYPEAISKLIIMMDLEIYCVNEFGLTTYYPSIHYDYDISRCVWIPTLTSERPYWEYDVKPFWA